LPASTKTGEKHQTEMEITECNSERVKAVSLHFLHCYYTFITCGISTLKSILISGPRQQPALNDPTTETDVGFMNLKTPVIRGR
jgi:hypothetical protein